MADPNIHTFGDARLSDRFWSKVKVSDCGCWFWIAYRDRKGYGVFSVRRENYRAHRISYVALVGPIPDGLQMDHLCRNTSCVNPAHLEAVTGQENVRRKVFTYKTHCLRGHKYTPENTGYSSHGSRNCKMCRVAIHREWRRANPEKVRESKRRVRANARARKLQQVQS